MKIPISWLKEYVDINMDIKTFMDAMTMSGSKTEGVERVGASLSGIITGRVKTIRAHNNADKLLVMSVDVGGGTDLQIVTAATNLKVGDIVPIATDGAILADGKEIKAGELRGELSQGMFCSVDELGSNRDSFPDAPEDGIYVFTCDTPIGINPVPLMFLQDDVVEFELTSNRPDCFSVLGLAREAAATFGVSLKFPSVGGVVGMRNPRRHEVPTPSAPSFGADGVARLLPDQQTEFANMVAPKSTDHIKIRVDNQEKCSRYCARVITNVKIAPSPLWLRRRLALAGLRPINNIVDVTNYVLHLFGHPMHAFNICNVRGGEIIVRNAKPGEVLTTLDGVERILDEADLLIADNIGGLAVAGVMGGENSMITDDVTTVLLESACFDAVSVRRTSKKLGLRTDSSAKFEKGLDPNNAITAINFAAHLIEEIGAGTALHDVVDCYPYPTCESEITFVTSNINNLLGLSISDDEIGELLSRLEIKTTISKGKGLAIIPTFRPDITTETDLAEEVARLYGYDKVPATLAGSSNIGKKTEYQEKYAQLKGLCAALGFNEALTMSFESPGVFDKLLLSPTSNLRCAAVIKNPLGEEFSVMRTTTAAAMLSSLATNYNRRNSCAALYEIARIYLPKETPMTELPAELNVLTFASYGDGDFYAVKGKAEYLLKNIGINLLDVKFTANHTGDAPHELSLPFLHPGRKAIITVNEKFVGYVGEVHPTVAETYEIGTQAYITTLYLDSLLPYTGDVTVTALPRFPAMRRDIALLCDETVTAGDLLSAIRKNGGILLEDAKFFDVYRGTGVEPGKKSMAFSLFFRHPDKTLVESEVSEVVSNILSIIKASLICKSSLLSLA
ncbi:MAG: phenylalanine--tRNA ligase subunit beta [Defluviitaleaceae bacterium]|nr:phenylalanine--tRNA ligase subunit beta [Defluviitaleaceae bacterium]